MSPGRRSRTSIMSNERAKLHVVSNDDDDVTDDVSKSNGSAELLNRSKRNGKGGIPPPKKGMGRPVGSQSRYTRALKEAVLLAAEQVGENDRGRGGLVGYLRKIARTEPRAFAALLGRVLPLQVSAKLDIDVALRERYPSVQEAQRAGDALASAQRSDRVRHACARACARQRR